MHNPLIRKMEQRGTLSREEKQVLDRAISRVVEFEAKQDLAREHDRPSECKLLLEGWANRYMTLADGRRQMVSIHISGDFVDLHSFPLKRLDHSIGAITPCKVALVPHDALREITDNHPRLTRLLWIDSLIDAAILRQWLFGTGRRSAIENMAHRLCELFTRLKVVNLVEDHTFRVPVTQIELGEALSISSVHVNRVLKDLRKEGMITWRGETVVIEDWDRLCQIAEFDPAYLNLQDEPR